VRVPSFRVKPIEKACQQDCTCAVDSIKLCQVDVD
jgi:hypothetical protein